MAVDVATALAARPFDLKLGITVAPVYFWFIDLASEKNRDFSLY